MGQGFRRRDDADDSEIERRMTADLTFQVVQKHWAAKNAKSTGTIKDNMQRFFLSIGLKQTKTYAHSYASN